MSTDSNKSNWFISIFLTFTLLAPISPTYSQQKNAGIFLYSMVDNKPYVLLAHHKKIPKNKEHGKRGWGSFGGGQLKDSVESYREIAARETYQETRKSYKRSSLLSQLKETTPDSIFIKEKNFVMYFLEVNYLSASKIEINKVPEDSIEHDERGPYSWISLDKLYSLVEFKNDIVKVDATFFPETKHAQWISKDLVLLFREEKNNTRVKLFSYLPKTKNQDEFPSTIQGEFPNLDQDEFPSVNPDEFLSVNIEITNVKNSWFHKRETSNTAWYPDLVHKDWKNHLAGSESYIEITFNKNGSTIPIDKTKLEKVIIESSRGDSIVRKDVNWEYTNELNIRLRDFGNEVRHRDILTITLHFSEKIKIKSPTSNEVILANSITKYFMYRNNTSFYPNTVWVPVGVFSTNFNSGEAGVSFAPLPIGIALGTKKFLKRPANKPEFYLGFSLVGNYMLFEGENETTNSETDQGFSIKTGTLGLLLDINNYVYIGYAYGFDFRNNFKDPGNLFTFGVGPSLLNWAKGQKR